MAVRCPRKRDSRYSWLVCLGASVSNGLAHSIVHSFGLLLPVFMKEFHQTREKTAFIGSLLLGTAYFLSLACGKVCQALGFRWSHAIASMTCATSLLITSWATGITFIFLSLSLVHGAGLGLSIMACSLTVSMYFEKKRSFALGLFVAGTSAAYFIMAPIMEALIKSVGWRNALRILSSIVFSTSVISILFDPNVESTAASHIIPSVETRDHDQPNTVWRRLVERFSFLKIPAYIIPATSLTIVSFSHWCVPIHLVRRCEELGISSKKSSYLYLGIGLGSLVSRIGAGKLCEIIWPVYVYQLGDICSVISSLVLAMTSRYPVLVVITLLYGLADGIFMTTFNVLIFNTVNQKQWPYAFGFVLSAVSLAVSFGPMITGLVADRHSYQEAFIMTGAITLIGGLVTFLLICFKGNQQKEEQVEKLLVFEMETVM